MDRFSLRPLGTLAVLTAALLLGAVPLAAQDAPAAAPAAAPGPAPSLGLSAALGTETIDGVTYQSLGLLPDVGFGPLGVGLDLSFHFRFYQQPGGDFGIYPRSADWWEGSKSLGQNLDKYLSRIVYLRWGHKGDPLYVMAGLLPSTTLGSGFLVGGYSNGALRPELRYTGVELDADGSLVGLPYGGFESFVGNISAFDVVGGRLYVKPAALWAPDVKLLQDLQVGFTVAADTNPFAQSTVAGSGRVAVYGADVIAPLYQGDWATARATLDGSYEGSHGGASIGFDGRLFGFLLWGVQQRFLGENFLPDYFDQGYEANRVNKFRVYNDEVSIPASAAWQASLGASILGDLLTFGTTLSGPWTPQDNVLSQPQLKGSAVLKNGVLPVGVEAYYIKNGLTSWADLTSPEDALIGAKVGYTIGAVTLNIIYDLRYLAPGETGPDGKNWVSTSRVETAVKFF